MNYIKSLFKINKKISTEKHIEHSEWVKFEDEKPPNDVVLAACDTSDCGWVMDTVWWYEDKKCWMITGANVSIEAHLPYTHWRRLPPYPNES